MKKVFYSPVSPSPIVKYAGLLLRTLVSYLGLLGLGNLIMSCTGLAYSQYWASAVTSPSYVALLAIPVALCMGAASVNKICAAVSPVVLAGGYFAVVSASYGNGISFTVKSALRIYNATLYTMTARGYTSLGKLMVSDGYDYTEMENAVSDPYRFAGAFLLLCFIGLVLYFTVQRKVRVIPLAVFITLIIAPILTYNIAKGNAGIGFTLCFICAALGMKVYDRAYSGSAERRLERKERRKIIKRQKKKERLEKKKAKAALKRRANAVFEAAIEAEMGMKKAKAARRSVYAAEKIVNSANAKNAKKADDENIKKATAEKAERKAAKAKRREVSYMGGFAGAGTALIVLLALWIPMTAVSGAFKVIEPINNKVQIVRTYVTAYLKGNDVDLNQLYAYGIDELSPRKLSFDPLEYNERKLFRVETTTDNSIYLRSWVGTNYDYKEEEWTSDDTDTVLAYRDKFGDDFTPDELSHSFYKYVYPSSTVIEDEKIYKNFLKYGFTVQKVDTWRVSGKSLLLFVPSHINTDIGLTAFGDLSEADYKYSVYYEGVYSSRFYKYGSGYGSVSYVSAYNRKDSQSGMDNSLEYFKLSKKYILEGKDMPEEEISDLLYRFDTEVSEKGLEYLGVSLPERYFYSFTKEEKADFLAYIEKEEEYSAYVKEKYTEKADSEIITEFANELLCEAGENASANTLARTLVEKFQKEYKFTLTPDSSCYTGEKTVLETFLSDGKEGYSTHFATAAAAILRELDIPVRYCEGIVASDFNYVNGIYRSYAYDYDASSWIEIYVDGMGWVMYEVCPGELYEKMYSPKSETFSEEDTEDTEDKTYNKFGEEKSESVSDIIARLGKTKKEEGESDLQWLLRRTVPLFAVIIFCLIIFLICRHIYKKAQKALGKRYEIIEKVRKEENYKKDYNEYSRLCGKINDYILEAFSFIGVTPENGELPAEFARRLFENYGSYSKISPTDVFDYMQKAEFGHGLSFEEADKCAEYLEDISVAIYKDMKFPKKIKYRYIKRKL